MKLTGWDAVDVALDRLSTLERRKNRAKGGADKRIAKIKEKLKAICKPLAVEWKRLTAQLEKWTFGHQDELQERTRRSAHGAVRLFKTPPAIVSDLDDDAVVTLLNQHRLHAYVRIKREPDRAAMRDLDDETLAKVGCRRESHDEFQWQLADETEWR